MLNEIYTGWRWPRVVDKVEHRPLDYAKIWRMAQSRASKPVRFGTCSSQVMGLSTCNCSCSASALACCGRCAEPGRGSGSTKTPRRMPTVPR
jgi:hypothetical protein